MIKTLKHQYRRMPKAGRLLFGVLFFLGVFVTTFRFIHADTIPFESSLSTMFSGWLNTGYYSNTRFKYGGNNFAGIIFRQSGSQTVSPAEIIQINSGAQAISCTQKLRGIYYNNQRGRRIRPLDTGNLAILSGQGSGYEIMTMTNGFYTQCSRLSGLFIPNPSDIFGQIDHNLSGQSFRMIAGVIYDFTGNAISGAQFGHTMRILTGGIYSGYMFDTFGGIAELSMNLPICGNFTVNPSVIIPQGTNTTFICEGNSVGGYLLSIFSSGGSLLSYDMTNSLNTTQIWMTGSNLATGTYTASCTMLISGTMGGVSCNSVTFQVGTGGSTGSVYTGGTGTCNPNFQGETNFLPYSGSVVINPSVGTYYTNKTGITIQWSATEPNTFFISGNFTPSPLSGPYIGHNIFTDFVNLPINLLFTGAWNTIFSNFTTGSCTYTDSAKRVYVDVIAPTTPSIVTPVSGATICASLPFNLVRNASSDSGSSLAGLPVSYRYEIYSNSGMTTGLVASGTSVTTGATLAVSSLPLATYYMNVSAVDSVGNISAFSTSSFTTSNSSLYCTTGSITTGVVIVTPTMRLRNVDLDKVYRSDPILVLGLTGPTLVTLSKGVLFINNGTGIGTTGIITSNDTLYIELISSDEYDTTVTGTLRVLGLTGTFAVTTKKSDCVLSAGEKLVIQNIYENLKDEYDNDISKFSDFLHTFQSMVEDEGDLTNSCTLEYLLSLIEDDFGIEGDIDTSNHITPNCKEYRIGYDASQRAYYAPEMMNRYYFVNRESLIRHLDYYNPGDCHINSYGDNLRTTDTSDPMKHIAPNGKIYHLIGQYGRYSATEFTTPKYFDSLDSIIRYIDLKNPPKDIRKHTVDTSFTPITYAAPNGKEYKIYKTDRGYMSYRLMKVRYYATLSELKSTIDKNNPSKY